MIERSKKHPNFNALEWAARAVSDDPGRPQVCVLLVTDDGTTAVGTDGRRLHEAKLDVPEAPGTYRVLKRTASTVQLIAPGDPMPYPNWQQVRSDEKTGRLERTYRCNARKRVAPEYSNVFCHILAGLPHRAGFNFELFKDLLPPTGQEFRVAQQHARSPLVLETLDAKFRGVLMPLILK